LHIVLRLGGGMFDETSGRAGFEDLVEEDTEMDDAALEPVTDALVAMEAHDNLVAMGFAEDAVKCALEVAAGDAERAVALLLDNQTALAELGR